MGSRRIVHPRAFHGISAALCDHHHGGPVRWSAARLSVARRPPIAQARTMSAPSTLTPTEERAFTAGPLVTWPVAGSNWLPWFGQVTLPSFGGSTMVPWCVQDAL